MILAQETDMGAFIVLWAIILGLIFAAWLFFTRQALRNKTQDAAVDITTYIAEEEAARQIGQTDGVLPKESAALLGPRSPVAGQSRIAIRGLCGFQEVAAAADLPELPVDVIDDDDIVIRPVNLADESGPAEHI